MAAACAIALGACSDDASDDVSGNGNAAPGAAAAVCDGQPFKPSAGSQRAKVAIFTDSGEGYEYTPYGELLPSGLEAAIPERATAVVCMEVVSSRVGERCEREGGGKRATEAIADATYEVRVYRASSGEQIAGRRMRAFAGECPPIAPGPPGGSGGTSYAKPAAQLTMLLEPIITG